MAKDIKKINKANTDTAHVGVPSRLTSRIITNWNEMTSKFLKQFFPAQLTKKLRREIQNFTQKDGDTLYEAWEEFQELQRKCPHHGISLDELVQAFYEGLDNSNKGMVDSVCGCTFMNKTGRTKNSRKSAGGRGGVYDIEARNQMITLDRKLDVLVKAFNGSNLGNQACGICSLLDHSTDSCPNGAMSEEELNFMGQQRQRYDPYLNTYNPGIRDHPNFRWSNNNAQPANTQGQGPRPSGLFVRPQSLAQGQQNLTSATQALVTGQQANSKEITELKKQMGQVIDFMGKIHESGKLPGQTLPNPNAGQFKIVTTRCSRVFEEPLLKKLEPSKEGEAENVFLQDDEDIAEVYAEKQPDKKAVPQSEREAAVPAEKKKVQEAVPLAVPADPKSTQAVLEKGKSSSSNGLVSTNVHARAPFPNRFAKSKHDEVYHATIELFKKVEVNMPLLECIQQNPKYAKFLKELCTNKRLPREKDVAVMNETISAVFQRKLPPKLKDLGSFSIPCTIGTHSFDKIMLDLGASINVMPSYLYADLGLVGFPLKSYNCVFLGYDNPHATSPADIKTKTICGRKFMTITSKIGVAIPKIL
uniref:uncharacterized protein LOC105353287 n=1 Tax=Fragaria vesca subsp. vesca TaxID=101020 RepID=UPI0005CA74DC|nr:PREDICTED: uncharacterized protein LOC105353287 [Fragaria vesca subsp. vesca]